MVGTAGPKENWPIAVMVRPDGNIEAYFMANWIVNVVVEPRHGRLVEKNIRISEPGFQWLLDAARDYLKDRQLPQPKGEPMTAKAIVTLHPIPPTPRAYPWVGVANTGTIILFTAPNVGTVIGITAATGGAAPSIWNLGTHSVNWAEMVCKEFTGTVTISN